MHLMPTQVPCFRKATFGVVTPIAPVSPDLEVDWSGFDERNRQIPGFFR
jgi:hypothetical protein